MKKKIYRLVAIILLINISACAGYKPIFSASNIEFKIAEYSIAGDKKIGKQIYSQLYSISKSTKEGLGVKNIYLLINSSKGKKVTAKNTAGEILGYKININTNILVKDISTGDTILDKSFSFSSTYVVQDQFSETVNLENRTEENLINKTYQN